MKTKKQFGGTYKAEYAVAAAAVLSAAISAASTFETNLTSSNTTATGNFATELGSLDSGVTTTSGGETGGETGGTITTITFAADMSVNTVTCTDDGNGACSDLYWTFGQCVDDGSDKYELQIANQGTVGLDNTIQSWGTVSGKIGSTSLGADIYVDLNSQSFGIKTVYIPQILNSDVNSPMAIYNGLTIGVTDEWAETAYICIEP